MISEFHKKVNSDVEQKLEQIKGDCIAKQIKNCEDELKKPNLSGFEREKIPEIIEGLKRERIGK